MTKPYSKLCSTLNLPREEWLTLRQKGIGGSDAGAILEMNPYSSGLTVYNDKLGISPPVEENERMRFGSFMEPSIATFFTEKTGKKARRFNFMLQSVEHPFMLANVDYIIPGEKAILECKVMYEMTRYKLRDGEYPPHYKMQCLHYMTVFGFTKAYLAIYKLGEGLYIFEIKRNEKEVAELVRKERHFWHEHVLKKVEPKPDGSDAYTAALQQRFQGCEEKTVPLFGLERWFRIREEGKLLVEEGKRQIAEAEQHIKLRLGHASTGQATGYMARWSETAGRTTLNTVQLKSEYPDVYEACLQQGEPTRKFTIKKIEEKPVAI